jgi:hypothetical protein
MNTNIVLNEEMKSLVDLGTENSNSLIFKPDKLKELFFPNFVKQYECITISSGDDSFPGDEEEFDLFVKGTYTDYTGYEASNTETYINYFVENEDASIVDLVSLAMIVAEVWGDQLKLQEPGSQFCFIISCDLEYKSTDIRFHKVRSGELAWLGDGWEKSIVPAACVFV